MKNKLKYGNWYQGTYQNYRDPRYENSNHHKCEYCDRDANYDSDWCDIHEKCIICGDNLACNCEDEMSLESYCCNDKWDPDTKRCCQCKESTLNSWDGEIENIKNRGRRKSIIE